jgi:hypothetical protein
MDCSSTATATCRPAQRRKPKVGHVPLSAIRPSPENDKLYRPIDPSDPALIALADSIAKLGILEPLVISTDGYVISGHRRYAAALLAGLESVPCRRVNVRRDRDPERFLQLLREHNRQRDKTNAERLREEVVSLNPDDAHAELYEYRRAKAAIDVEPLEMRSGRRRKAISAAKAPMLAAVENIVEQQQKFLPLSVRQLHYGLLNDPPLKHASKPDSTYANDAASYKSLTDLVARARLTGEIPFNAIADETRPVNNWDGHDNTRPFLARELRNMFRGYCRNLQQSQPNHIELIGEKNTVASILRPVASEYMIPLTTGRGYCSLPPRHAMAERFRRSGKDILILLIVSDFDPDGEEIASSFARSMRDDFAVKDIHPIKVALTAEQVERFSLPPGGKAKAGSSSFKRFVSKYGHNVFELEALPPETLQQLVREAIEGVIDRDAYAAEIAAERQDAVELSLVRQQVVAALQGLDMGGER